ncbi:outer membrane beta-barrel protein [Pedobacter panaciterrae]|uniref:outer membrane beta-barrel family protein n=1 Tax=Pedobacter panaciterrae TaxID=363849 RepID=UPI00155DDCBA|nr:outer membrane beta-barrel family protein [Pedobacter panaciterrae]NQX54560.1 outer membrane beta-barrel protein [Pedobacter panaciterrae]
MTNSFLRVTFTLWIAIAPILAAAQSKPAQKKDTAGNKTDTLKKTVDLKEVKISGKKSFIEHKIDRTVINVDALISNAGSNALEVLEKAPGVMVDQDGKISLKGQQGVVVLIDNRPTYLSEAALTAYLKSLPSGSISQIELIPNPPARYDAAGGAGIINIRTKKSLISGWNGSINAGTGYSPNWRHNESIDLNYRKNKFNFFTTLGYNKTDTWRDLDINRWFYDQDQQLTSAFMQSTVFRNRNKTPNIKAGMDFYVSEKTTLGFVFTGSYNSGRNRKEVGAIATGSAGQRDSLITALNSEQSKLNSNGINFNYSHKFDSLGRELSFDLDHISYSARTDQSFANRIFNTTNNSISEENLVAQLPSDIAIYAAKGDYEHPLAYKAKFSAGAKTSFVNTDNTADYFIRRGDVLLVDNEKTNHFRYKENINAAYVNFSKEWKKWSIQAGLRMEQTNMKGHQLSNGLRPDSSFSQHYTNLFPTVYLSYKLDSAKNKLTLYYGKRIRRPYYQDLNPFIFLLDKFTYFAGNPYIRPEFAHKIDLNFNHNNKLSIDLFYNVTSSMISEVIEQEKGIFISRTGNIGKMHFYGGSVNLNLKAGNWYTLNMYSEAVEIDFSGLPGNDGNTVQSFYFYVNPNNQFNFGRGWSAELSAMYVTPNQNAQFKKRALYNINTGVSKKILGDKGTLKFTLRDVLNRFRPQGEIINIPQTRATYRNIFDNRIGLVSFSYSFSKGASAAKKRNTGGAGNELERVKN